MAVARRGRPPEGGARQAILLMGPTACGKTELSIALADALGGRGLGVEIVSVDSVQVYRGMDIGSAKPSVSERRGIAHHLIDIHDPGQAYSTARFRRDALDAIDDIQRRGKTPLLVGGTMLYFRALTSGLSALPSADAALRARISDQARQSGWPALHKQLSRLDPETAARLHPNDGQRIQRALEVVTTLGLPMSHVHALHKPHHVGLNFLKFAIAPPERAELHRRIERRLEAMFEAGFLAEVEALHHRRDLSETLPSIRSVGYRQLWNYLDGKCHLDQAKVAALAATRQFAKRQCTWLRSEHDPCWLNFDSEAAVDAARQRVEAWLQASA